VKEGEQKYDNIHLFIRCVWSRDSLGIYLNWENFDSDNHKTDKGIVFDYIATKSDMIGKDLRRQIIENKHNFMAAWRGNAALPGVSTTSRKASVLRMLKYEMDCTDLTVDDVLDRARPIIAYYETQITHIQAHTKQVGKYLKYEANNTECYELKD
jgi:hypothetical protein